MVARVSTKVHAAAWMEATQRTRPPTPVRQLVSFPSLVLVRVLLLYLFVCPMLKHPSVNFIQRFPLDFREKVGEVLCRLYRALQRGGPYRHARQRLFVFFLHRFQPLEDFAGKDTCVRGPHVT